MDQLPPGLKFKIFMFLECPVARIFKESKFHGILPENSKKYSTGLLKFIKRVETCDFSALDKFKILNHKMKTSKLYYQKTLGLTASFYLKHDPCPLCSAEWYLNYF